MLGAGKIKNRLKEWMLNELLKESGVDLSPEEGVWGEISPAEEENVLSRLWDDKPFIALLRKYAERANRRMIAKAVMNEQYWKFRGQFFCYNEILVKARRAAARLRKYGNKDTQTEGNVEI